jgi:hypothetical protein
VSSQRLLQADVPSAINPSTDTGCTQLAAGLIEPGAAYSVKWCQTCPVFRHLSFPTMWSQPAARSLELRP